MVVAAVAGARFKNGFYAMERERLCTCGVANVVRYAGVYRQRDGCSHFLAILCVLSCDLDWLDPPESNYY